MSCETWLEHLSAHCDGELQPGLARDVEEHLSRCQECRHILDQLKLLRETGRGLVQPVAPSALRHQVMGRIDRDREEARRPFRRFLVLGMRWGVPAMACCFLVLAVRFYFWQTPGSLDRTPRVPRVLSMEEPSMERSEVLGLREGEPSETLEAREKVALEPLDSGRDVASVSLDRRQRRQDEEQMEAGLYVGGASEAEPKDSRSRGAVSPQAFSHAPAPLSLRDPSRLMKSEGALDADLEAETMEVESLDRARQEMSRLVEAWNGKLISSTEMGQGRLELVIVLPRERILDLRASLGLEEKEPLSRVHVLAKDAGGQGRLAEEEDSAIKREEDMVSLRLLLVERGTR